MLGFFGVDITIDADGKPYLIELNGSNSGFDGFLVAYEDLSIEHAISAAFAEFAQGRPIQVISRLTNLGELPRGYLDKLALDMLYFASIENVHRNLHHGVAGTAWARMRTDRTPSKMGAGTSLDALAQLDPRFRMMALNVEDPSYVIPDACFKEEAERGALSFRDDLVGDIPAHRLTDEDLLWFRCSSLAFAEPIATGIQVNPPFPYDAIADNKWFTYTALLDTLADHLPPTLPLGNRCSGAASVRDLLARAAGDLFIRKPLRGSQAKGIEILHRRDLEEYAGRLEQLERHDRLYTDGLPLELQGVPALLSAGALSLDVTVVSALALSKPVPCRWTGRRHHGCIRALVLVRQAEGAALEARFLGAYWRLARIPVDGDGLQWERIIGSQSQGSFCERVSAEDLCIAERFSTDVLRAYYGALVRQPDTWPGYKRWEYEYWRARYREEVPWLRGEGAWSAFEGELEQAEREVVALKERAEAAGFRRVPTALLDKQQAQRARLPYLVREPQRIVVRPPQQ